MRQGEAAASTASPRAPSSTISTAALDPDVPERDHLPWIGLDADVPCRPAGHGGDPPLLVAVLIARGLLLDAHRDVFEADRVLVTADTDLVLEPGAGHQRRARHVLLPRRITLVQVIDEVTGGDLVDRARPVLP